MIFRTVTASAMFAIMATGAMAQNFDREKDRVFVTGVGKVEVVPDVAIVVLGAQSRHPDWATANERARVAADAIRLEIRAAGIPEEDVTTNAVSVSPVMDYRTNEGPRIVAYQSSISVRVKVRDMSRAGPLIDAAVAAGATNVYGPSFEVSDPERFEKEARALAMRDARDRAETLAEAGGFEISGIVSVAENSVGRDRPYPMMARGMMMEAMDSAPATKISSGTTEISVSVSAIFSLWGEQRD